MRNYLAEAIVRYGIAVAAIAVAIAVAAPAAKSLLDSFSSLGTTVVAATNNAHRTN